MSYTPNPSAPGYWQYKGLPIQADVETHQYAVEAVRKHLPRAAHVLDVAAGRGALSQALIDAGFKLSCTSWNDRVGLPIDRYRIDLDQAFELTAVGGQEFDAACALEIIEHVENPAQMLRSLAGAIRTGGFLVLSTPNVESAQARLEWLLKGCPYSFSESEIRDNRHISMLWRQGLEKFIALAGFDIVEKQLVGEFRFHSALQRWTRGPLLALLRRLLPGDTDGTSRVYLLKRNGMAPRVMGSDEVP